jgi:hypothetical protein
MSESFLQVLSAARDCGVLLAAFLGIWKWGFEESLRKRREVPSVQGELSSSITRHTTDTAIVSILATWATKSPARVEVDVERTSIAVFRIPAEHPIGSLIVNPESVEAVARVFPFRNLNRLSFGPNNEHTYASNFILKVSQRYLIRWRLYIITDGFRRTREVIIDTTMPSLDDLRVETSERREVNAESRGIAVMPHNSAAPADQNASLSGR